MQRMRRAYREEIDVTERALLVTWSTFGLTFGLTPAITLWLRSGRGPAGGESSSMGATFITTTWVSPC